jgi:4'-phosphopantetheinyl transferase
VEPSAGRELQFNVSHSGALALYAFAWQEPVGVDLEEIRPMADRDLIAARFFRPAEACLLRRLGPEDHLQTFYQLWTQKEAVIKANGGDLDDALSPGHFSTGASRPRTRGRTSEQSWTVTRLHPAPGYAAAVALAGVNPHLHCWQWLSGVSAGKLRTGMANCA